MGSFLKGGGVIKEVLAFLTVRIQELGGVIKEVLAIRKWLFLVTVTMDTGIRDGKCT